MELEKDCPECKGQGWRQWQDKRVTCYYCVGGKKPSEEGRKFLEFIQKYISVSCYTDGDLDEGRSVGELIIR